MTFLNMVSLNGGGPKKEIKNISENVLNISNNYNNCVINLTYLSAI